MTISDALVVGEEVLQPVDGFQVQVVGGLVQEQGLGVAEQGLGQQHAHLLAALQLAHGALVQVLGHAQAVQQDGRVALGGVAVLVRHDPFQFAQAHAVGVGHLGLGVDPVPLLQGLPQGLVAHDHGVHHPERVEGELVLGQHAHLPGALDGAGGGLLLPGEQLHEGGLAAAVGAGEAVAAPGQKVVVTSSNRILAPKRIVTFCTASIQAPRTLHCIGFLGKIETGASCRRRPRPPAPGRPGAAGPGPAGWPSACPPAAPRRTGRGLGAGSSRSPPGGRGPG